MAALTVGAATAAAVGGVEALAPPEVLLLSPVTVNWVQTPVVPEVDVGISTAANVDYNHPWCSGDVRERKPCQDRPGGHQQAPPALRRAPRHRPVCHGRSDSCAGRSLRRAHL